MLDELDEGEMGSARLVATKQGEGRAQARSRDLDAVGPSCARRSPPPLAAPLQPPPPRSYPAELRITAEGEEIARTTVSEPADLLRTIADAFRTSQVSREYRQLAKLLPAGQFTPAQRSAPPRQFHRDARDALQGAPLAQPRSARRLIAASTRRVTSTWPRVPITSAR